MERRIIELARAQVARGDDVLIMSLPPEAERPVQPVPGPRIHDVACRSRRPLRDMELAARSWSAIRAFDPHIVHVHGNVTAAVVLAGVGGVGGAKVLTFDFFRYRGAHRRAAWAAYRRALSAFDLLMPVSEFCAREAAAWWSLPREDFRVLPNGVNIDQFRPDGPRREAARQRYGLDGAVTIGYVGRVCEQKGSDTLVAAFREVKRARPGVSLLVAGPSDFFGLTRPTAITEEIDAVGGRWLGPVPEDELADVFRSLDVCAMPTRQDEMFGMAAAEALSSGTPVVCSRLGGLPEVVPSSAGVLVPADDATALANALIALCDDPVVLARLAAAAPAAASRFSWPVVAELAEARYREVLDR